MKDTKKRLNNYCSDVVLNNFDIKWWMEDDLKEEIWCGNIADLSKLDVHVDSKMINTYSVDRTTHNIYVLQPH